MGSEGHGDGSVKVSDHRRFDAEGNPKEGDEVQADAGQGQTVAPGAGESRKEETEGQPRELPPMDFATFILSLATSAQVHLGIMPNPSTGKTEPNRAIAKETIDIIGMLEEKTKGNLTSEEARLMEHLLYDLRMMYVGRP